VVPITNETHREIFERPLFERYTFVMVSTQNLASARKFWVDQLGFPVTEERPGESFIIDAGGLRLWIDLKDSEEKLLKGSDPAIGLKVRSVKMVLSSLAARGITEKVEPLSADTGLFAIIHDPDGRAVVLTETGE
jgi:catechol-2,3-dioxygenase